jgi:peptidoglycan hydrolase-like protein with peptidoglycan-binding domain
VLSLQRALGNRYVQRVLDGGAGESRSHRPPPSIPPSAVQRDAEDAHDLQSELFAGEPTLEACFDDKARLRPGDSGTAVRKLQEALIAVGLGDELGPKGADGIYGSKTAETVRRFKREQKLGFEQFGDAGPGTIGRLDSMLPKGSPKPPPGPTPPGPTPPGPTPPGPTPPPSGITVIPCPGNPFLIASSATKDCAAGDDFLSGDFVGGAKRLSLKNEVIRTRFSSANDIALEAMFRAAIATGGALGQDMVTIFMAGAGGKSPNAPGSPLSTLVAASPTFQRAAGGVKTEVDTQIKAQAAAGVVNCGALRVTDPTISFPFSELQLKTLIGGTQGNDVFIKNFAVPPGGRTYSAVLVFVVCDDFGVDESDLDTAIGLSMFPFWELQHGRRGHRPFVNEFTVEVPIAGSF